MSRPYQDKTHRVKSDGYFRTGDVVAYNTTGDQEILGNRYAAGDVKAVISDISYDRRTRKYTYEVKLGSRFGHHQYIVQNNVMMNPYTIWTNKKKIRKPFPHEKLNDFCFAKYKIGDTVYHTGGYLGHIPLKVKYFRTSAYNEIDYELESVDGLLTSSSEKYIRDKQIVPTKSRFKIDDRVIVDFWFLKGCRCKIDNIYAYDGDVENYYLLSGKDLEISDRGSQIVMESYSGIRLDRPPLIIISSLDPYGEEDWTDD